MDTSAYLSRYEFLNISGRAKINANLGISNAYIPILQIKQSLSFFFKIYGSVQRPF